jgi:hypothetical protein
VTARRLLLVGLGLLVLAFALATSFDTWTEQSVFAVRFWFLQVLTVTGCGSVVAAALVSALTADRRAPAPEPAVDHFA